MFLYSQDLSNRKTQSAVAYRDSRFLYSQDLSNRKTLVLRVLALCLFLYSQDLSNRKTLQFPHQPSLGFCTLKI